MKREIRYMLVALLAVGLAALGVQYAQADSGSKYCTGSGPCGRVSELIGCYPWTVCAGDCWHCTGISEFRTCLPGTGQCTQILAAQCGTLLEGGVCDEVPFNCHCNGGSGVDYCFLAQCND